MRLQDKVALITGGGTGLGRAMALLFAHEGARVALAGRRLPPLEDTRSAVEAAGGEALVVSGDVTDETDTRRMVEAAVDRWGRLDILINNAGVNDRTPVTESTVEAWRTVVAVNLDAVFLTCRVAIPKMIEAGGGCIINIASISGHRGQPNISSYCAAKAGVINLTRAMAIDYGPYGIRVNALSPGLVETAMSRTRLQPGESWEARAEKEWIPLYPLGRIGTPEDIARGALFLASPDAAWITGIDLPIDGGYTARL